VWHFKCVLTGQKGFNCLWPGFWCTRRFKIMHANWWFHQSLGLCWSRFKLVHVGDFSPWLEPQQETSSLNVFSGDAWRVFSFQRFQLSTVARHLCLTMTSAVDQKNRGGYADIIVLHQSRLACSSSSDSKRRAIASCWCHNPLKSQSPLLGYVGKRSAQKAVIPDADFSLFANERFWTEARLVHCSF
jgi:hypothetical protein